LRGYEYGLGLGIPKGRWRRGDDVFRPGRIIDCLILDRKLEEFGNGWNRNHLMAELPFFKSQKPSIGTDGLVVKGVGLA
jgi:hypothetical protein